MADYYKLKICGLTRQLPLKGIGRKTKLANFNIVGDIELVEKVSQALFKKIKKFNFDYLVGPSVKSVPLVHELSKKFGIEKYVICRKSIKPFMISPVVLKPLPHFPKHVKELVIDGADQRLLKGKKVVVVDDVVSTGVTMRMMKKLMEKIGAEVVAVAAIILQGENQFDQFNNLVYLTTMPIFKTS